MFKVEEIRFITHLIDEKFFLSPRSVFEYITTYDIETIELLVKFDIAKWLKNIRMKYSISYQKKDKKYFVEFLDDKVDICITSLAENSIDEYLSKMKFNIEAVAIEISPGAKSGFDSYETNNKTYYANWVDPYAVKRDIEANYLAPTNYKILRDNGELIFRMVAMMSIHGFDIKKELITYLKKNKSQVKYKFTENTNRYMFKILERIDAYKYLTLLDELGVLEGAYPLITEMKKENKNDKNLWEHGLSCLNEIENIIYTDGYFADSIGRAYRRNGEIIFPTGINKIQMLKFATLFHDVNSVMILPANSAENYEDNFIDFCANFDFEKDECVYFSQVTRNNKNTFINIRDDIENGTETSREDQYEFYDDFKNNTLDVLLILFVDILCLNKDEELLLLKRVENIAKSYISKYCELQSLNGEITSLDLNYKKIGDADMLVILNDVKKKVFLGTLRYDKHTIIRYIEDVISQLPTTLKG